MAERVEALVKPELLVWARESAGFTVDAAAKKAHVTPNRLASWETGESRPTINQLRRLGEVYKRPLAVFYLDSPPHGFDALRDFRRLPGKETPKESPRLRLEIRRAWHRRQLALDLYQELDERVPKFTATASVDESPEEIGDRIRKLVGLEYRTQVEWESDRDAFYWWRGQLEALGILVGQASGVSVKEMRGFSLAERPLPVIVVNSKEVPVARIFTMIHELSHIMIREGGLCDLHESSSTAINDAREVFCNRVAGAALVPKNRLLKEEVVVFNGDKLRWSDSQLEVLADRYRVSQETILRRLLITGRTSEAFYREKRAQLLARYEVLERRKSTGGPPVFRRTIGAVGPLFARLVVESYLRERITASDVSDYLDVRLKHLPAIEDALRGDGSRGGPVL